MEPNLNSISFLKNVLSENFTWSPITNSGSNRKYFRIKTVNGKSYILTENENIPENKSFIYFSNLMKKHHVAVPYIYFISPDQHAYLQEDVGETSLLDGILSNGYTDENYLFYQKSLTQLAAFQLATYSKLDVSKCYDFKIFDEKVVLNDLFYFKSFFLDRLELVYQKSDLISDILKLSNDIKALPSSYFLFRDFQARNIFIKDKIPYFIDYQGGMSGFLGYDLVSLLYQAKANLPDNWKIALKNSYFEVFLKTNLVSQKTLEKGYQSALILRIFQLFGAYGLRGLIERKPHFLDSILLNIENLHLLLSHNYLAEYPSLKEVSLEITTTKTVQRIKELIHD